MTHSCNVAYENRGERKREREREMRGKERDRDERKRYMTRQVTFIDVRQHSE